MSTEQTQTTEQPEKYFVPKPSGWPIIGCLGLFLLAVGLINWVHQNTVAPYFIGLGVLVVLYMLYGWFRAVIHEDQAGFTRTPQMHRTFRLSFYWFIFTELMLFVTLFGVLFYTRVYVVPWLGGEGSGQITHLLLWPDFQNMWPVFNTPNPAQLVSPHGVMEPHGIPALNTLIMLSSSVTLTVAYFGLVRNHRIQLIIGQILTILLGCFFVVNQFREYAEAFTKGLYLSSGIYGNTFYFLTAIDALHVIAGIIMMLVILWRIFGRQFDKKNHFAYSAVFWYWNFVVAIWLSLFVFVYWV